MSGFSTKELMPRVDSTLRESSSEVVVPTPWGTFGMRAWNFADGSEHLSVRAVNQQGAPIPDADPGAPAVRIHSECATGDIFGSLRCDCGPQLHQGLQIIQRQGGYLVLLRNHEGRGIGLVNKLRAYALQDAGQDTVDANLSLGVPADARDYRQAVVILRELGLNRVRLVTNNPAKVAALTELDVMVAGTVADEVAPQPLNVEYLQTKKERMNHVLSHPDLEETL